MELKRIDFELYEQAARRLPMPKMAYGLCGDENRDVLLVYEELRFDDPCSAPVCQGLQSGRV